MLSKPLYPLGEKLQERKSSKNGGKPMILNKTTIDRLSEYTIPQLKEIAKQNALPVSGTKPIIIQRLQQYFIRAEYVIKIQSCWRKYKLAFLYYLRNLRLKNDCVNSSDFYTLEPINEIHPLLFTCITDTNNFTYGFSIVSLEKLIKSGVRPKNPYTREIFDTKLLGTIVIILRLTHLFFGKYLQENNIVDEAVNENLQITQQTQSEIQIQTEYRQRHVSQITSYDNFRQVWIKVRVARFRPLCMRVQELFMEIDHLGNYTQANWFSDLGGRSWYRFYQLLYEIWNYRAQITAETKRGICILGDPFRMVDTPRMEYPPEVIYETSLTVFEYFVYGGIDEEHRKLGTLHALTALTAVSYQARNSLQWLYTSLL